VSLLCPMRFTQKLWYIRNESADEEAEEAARRASNFIPIPFADYYSIVKKQTYEAWLSSWSTTKIPERNGVVIKGRRNKVVINRLFPGHCTATHIYPIEDLASPPLICEWCDEEMMSVKHVIVGCRILQVGNR